MFDNRLCELSSCDDFAAFARSRCFRHLPDTEEYRNEIYQSLQAGGNFSGLNVSQMPFLNLDIPKSEFRCCRFSRSAFRQMNFRDCHFINCTFDFAVHEEVQFLDCSFVQCVLAGARLEAFQVRSCELVENNFNGCHLSNAVFDDCDLSRSRFIGAHFFETEITNCNVREAYFIDIVQNRLSFRMSNPEDAFMARPSANSGGELGYAPIHT